MYNPLNDLINIEDIQRTFLGFEGKEELLAHKVPATSVAGNLLKLNPRVFRSPNPT